MNSTDKIKFLTVKTNLKLSTIRATQALLQETILVDLDFFDYSRLKTSFDLKKQQKGLLLILLWHLKMQVNEEELKILYYEWCRTQQIDLNSNRYFLISPIRGENSQIDLILQFLNENNIPSSQYENYVISFLDSLNLLNNHYITQFLQQNDVIDDLENLYQYFDPDGLGCFSATNGVYLLMVLELSRNPEERSSTIQQFSKNLYYFFKDIYMFDGLISLRAFKNYFIRNRLIESTKLKKINESIREILNISQQMDKEGQDKENFVDIMDIALELADNSVFNQGQMSTNISRQILKNFILENYFNFANQLNQYEYFRIFDTKAFLKYLTLQIQGYYGQDFLQLIKMTVNAKFISVFVDSINEFYNQVVTEYIEISQRWFHNSYLDEITIIDDIDKENHNDFQSSNYFSFQNNTKIQELFQNQSYSHPHNITQNEKQQNKQSRERQKSQNQNIKTKTEPIVFKTKVKNNDNKLVVNLDIRKSKIKEQKQPQVEQKIYVPKSKSPAVQQQKQQLQKPQQLFYKKKPSPQQQKNVQPVSSRYSQPDVVSQDQVKHRTTTLNMLQKQRIVPFETVMSFLSEYKE